MSKRSMIGLVLGGIGAICLVISLWPFKQVPFEVPVRLSSGEQAIINGSLPGSAWAGEEFSIHLSFKLTSPENASTGHFRAAVDLPHAQISPKGDISLTFESANEVKITWKVTPESAGKQQGTLWIYAGVGAEPEAALLARSIQVNVITFLGITARWYRWAGIGFLAAGAFFILAFGLKPAKGHLAGKKGRPVRKK